MPQAKTTPELSRRHILVGGLALCALLTLSACETPVAVQNLPDITFAHLPAIAMDVASIEIENRFSAPLAAPHVEHRLPVAPAVALAQWAKDRLKPVGETGKLKLIIEDARVTETLLTRDKSLKGNFTKQQSHRYDFAINAALVLSDANGAERGTASTATSRSITLREDLSLNDWEKTLFNATDRLLGDFNTEMEANLRRHLVNWVR
ncbi:MAG: hypothetical protein HOH04_01780 [Rhodospirillaceae bacterium]|jgi:hypothetical protein|nr:hypothetical protein [Rhodospirillaceae bacterium]